MSQLLPIIMLTINNSTILRDAQSIISYFYDSNHSENQKQELIENLANYFNQQQQQSTQDTLINDLSLELPSIILNRINSNNKIIPNLITILNGLVRYGNPKELFMAFTTTILQTLSTTQSNNPLDHLFNIILHPLSIVFLKILPNSRNPAAFFDPFSQCLLGLLDRCRGSVGEEEIAQSLEVYQELVDVCQKAVSLRAHLELKSILLLASSASLIFASPHNQFPFGKAFLCYRDLKWRSSFSRLIRAQSNPTDHHFKHLFSNQIDPVQKIQELIAPILLNLNEPRQIKDQIVQITDRLLTDHQLLASLAELGHGALSGQELVRVTQQGALVIQALDRFSKLGLVDQPTPTAIIKLVQTLITPSFIDTSLFLLLSEPVQLSEELASKLIGLASNDPSSSNRLLIFRSLAYLVQDLHPPTARLQLLATLIDHHPSQPNIRSALVSLLRETLAHLAREGLLNPTELDQHTPTIPQILHQLLLNLIHSTPLDLRDIDQAWSSGEEEDRNSADELVKYTVERLNLVYLLLKIDLHNLIGVRNGTLNGHVKQLLISPVHLWLAARSHLIRSPVPSIHADNSPLRAILFPLHTALQLCVDSLNLSS